nr:DUF3108 domain-containing protein [Thauera linaloolentis]
MGGGAWRPVPAVVPELPEPFIQARLIVPPPEAEVPVKAAEAPVAELPPAGAAEAPALKAAPAPRPVRKPRPKPASAALAPPAEPVQVALAAPAAGGGQPASDAPAAAVLAPPMPQAPPIDPMAGAAFDVADADGWPREGAIVYRVMMGDKGFEVGQASHSWSHDTRRYDMRVELKTTGVAALMRSFHYVQRSEGEVGERGLRPLRFTVEQRGRASDAVEFDWSAGKAIIRRGSRAPRAVHILPGDQDVLSLWHQVGIVGTNGLPATLTVLTNKTAKPALLEVVGPEGLRLPIGRLDTVRLRAQAEDGSLSIDIWLASRYGMLPVRIRIADDDGEVLDQQAIQLRLTPAAGAGGLAGGEAAGEIMLAERVELKEETDPMADLYR